MGILAMNGFEARNPSMDGVIQLAGTIAYETFGGNLPPGSPSLSAAVFAALRQAEIPWVSGETGSVARREPSGTEYWFHYQFVLSTNNTSNDLLGFGVSRNGSPLIMISHQDNTLLPTLRIGAGLVATAAGSPTSLNIWRRFHVHVTGHAEGDVISIYSGGVLTVPVLQYTLTAGDAVTLGGLKPNAFLILNTGTNAIKIDNIFALDPNDSVSPTDINKLLDAHVEPIFITGNSATYADWTGSYTDIDDIPYSDADDIDVASVDQVSTFSHGTPTKALVFYAQSKWRVTRTDVVAGANIQIRGNSAAVPATYIDEPITPAPGDGFVIQHHPLAPDGTEWSKAKFIDTEFGPVSRT